MPFYLDLFELMFRNDVDISSRFSCKFQQKISDSHLAILGLRCSF